MASLVDLLHTNFSISPFWYTLLGTYTYFISAVGAIGFAYAGVYLWKRRDRARQIHCLAMVKFWTAIFFIDILLFGLAGVLGFKETPLNEIAYIVRPFIMNVLLFYVLRVVWELKQDDGWKR